MPKGDLHEDEALALFERMKDSIQRRRKKAAQFENNELSTEKIGTNRS